MAQHTHDVYDTGKCFEINGISRFIKETSSTKLVLVQGDHKSEVVTFQMPRYIDGHDMLLCNKIRVHYINIETGTNNKSADIYEVTDLALCEECEDILTFTWTVEAPATKYYGPLSFLIKFECTEGENILYQWNTAKYVGVNVLSGIDNSEDFVDKYSNVLEEWYNKLTRGADSFEELTEQSLNTIQDETDAAIDAIKKCSDDTYQEFAIAADARAKRVLEDMPESYDALNESVIDMKKMWEHGTNLVDNKTRMIYMNGNLADEDIIVDVEENGVLTINGSVEKDTLLCLTNEEYDRFLHHYYYTVLSDIKDFSGSNTTSLEAGFFIWGHSNGNYYYKNLTPVNITPEFSKERVLLLKQNDGAFFYDRYEVLFGVLLKAGTTFDGFQIRVWCVEDGDSEVYEPFWYHLKELDDYVNLGLKILTEEDKLELQGQIDKNTKDIGGLSEKIDDFGDVLNGISESVTEEVLIGFDSIYLTGPARYGFLLPVYAEGDGLQDNNTLVRGEEVTLYCPVFRNQTVMQTGALSQSATATANSNVTFDADGYYTFTPNYDKNVPYIRFVCFNAETTEADKMYMVTKKHVEKEVQGLIDKVEKLETFCATNESVDKKISQAVNKDLKILFASDIHFGVENQLTDDRRWGYTDDERMEIFIETIKHENSLGTLDCIIFAGDQVSNTDKKDWQNGNKDYLPEFIERMKAIGIPFYCANGNHELYTDEKWRALFGYGSNYIISIKDYDIIVLNNFVDTSATHPTQTGYHLSDISNDVKTSILNYLNVSDSTKAIVVSHYCEEDTMELPNTAEVVAHEKVLFAVDGHCHTLKGVNDYTIGGKPVLNCGNFSTDTTPSSYFSYRIFIDEDGLVQSYAVKPTCDYEVNGEIVSQEYTKCYSKTFEDGSVDYGIDIIKL